MFPESSFPQSEVKVGVGREFQRLALPQKRGRKTRTKLVGANFISMQCKAIEI